MIELKNVSKTFDSGTGEVDALKNVSLTIEDQHTGYIVAMIGTCQMHKPARAPYQRRGHRQRRAP